MQRSSGKTSSQHPPTTGGWKIALAALGVVYGDIGTSPLYALKECFSPHYGIALNEHSLLGLLSLFFWSLVLVVIVKYIVFFMKAHNNGEGGIVALLSLVMPKQPGGLRPKNRWVILIGLFGCCLLYGDGMITPAISVLSAVEGLQLATPALKPFVVPLSIGILMALFWSQKRGTAFIGALFGPIILIWFICIAALGIPWIIAKPQVLFAINPYYAWDFFMHYQWAAFFSLGAIVLCVTGGEAMYADMGHFGRRPIKFTWYWVVFPALVLNYFGQGALILEKGESVLHNPFYELVPDFFLYPMIAIATMAAVIASQALITGLYSLTHQTTQLGYLPRFHVVHTSEKTEGQIYIPEVNRILMICCVALVVFFQNSSGLTAAYGIAVTGTMTASTILFYLVSRKLWQWSRLKALTITIPILFIDLSFFTSNFAKFYEGGWFPILTAAAILTVMLTWRQGRNLLSQAMLSKSVPLEHLINLLETQKPHRVPGTAMVLTANRDIAPPVLLHHLKHNQVMHQQVILLTVHVTHKPFVPADERLEISHLNQGLVRVIAQYGYIQRPNVSEIIRLCKKQGVEIDKKQTSFYLGRETLLSTGPANMAVWRKELFAFLSRNAQNAIASFRIPPDQVVEIGLQLEI
ncbi:MAG: potassium transporter Kup [Bdellovibrionales bacterium]